MYLGENVLAIVDLLDDNSVVEERVYMFDLDGVSDDFLKVRYYNGDTFLEKKISLISFEAYYATHKDEIDKQTLLLSINLNDSNVNLMNERKRGSASPFWRIIE